MNISLYPKSEINNELLLSAAENGVGFDDRKCKCLEKAIGVAVGVGAVKMTSGYVNACRNLLYAWSIGKNEAVFVSSFTSAVMINIIRECGASVILVDCDADTWHMSAEKLRTAVKKCLAQGKLYPRAVFADDTMGVPFDADAISSVCNEFGLLLIEDAYFSMGASYKGKMAGSLGDAAVMSFEPPFFTGTFGRSGAIMTDDQQLAKVIHLTCNGGFKLFSTSTGVKETVRTGEFACLDEFTASLIFSSFTGRVERVRKRQNNAKAILSAAKECKVAVQKSPEGACGAYPFVALKAESKEEMSRIVCALKDAGIQSSGFYSKPLCRHSALRYLDYYENDMPVGSNLSVTLFAVPCHESLEQEEVSYICETLRKVCR